MTVAARKRNRLLDVLIILAVLFWFPQFLMMEKVIWARNRKSQSRSRPAPGVGSNRGVDNEDDAIAEPEPSVGGHEFSPPLSRHPNACPHIWGLIERGRER